MLVDVILKIIHEYLAAGWRQRSLLLELVVRDVSGRYRGSAMGMLWSLLTPVLMLAIYTFVFSVVFKSRWGEDQSAGKMVFALNLFAGMLVHGLVAECLNRAPGLIIGNVSYVKKVVFPLGILPWVGLGSALFHALIGLMVLLVFEFAIYGGLPLTAPLVLLVWLPLLVGMLGVMWLLAALGVYLRDIAQLTGILTTILMFLSPVFYPATALPEPYRTVLYLNPLTFLIEQTRAVLLDGVAPDWLGLVMAMIVASVVAMLGYNGFKKMRRGFADVI